MSHRNCFSSSSYSFTVFTSALVLSPLLCLRTQMMHVLLIVQLSYWTSPSANVSTVGWTQFGWFLEVGRQNLPHMPPYIHCLSFAAVVGLVASLLDLHYTPLSDIASEDSV